MTAADVSRAIVLWSGHGSRGWPVRDPDLVEAEFGDRASEVMPVVTRLATEFDDSDAIHRVADIGAAGELAAREFRQRHPELSDAAIDALAWCYTWDNR